MEKARIAVLVSGGGTNLQALLDAGSEGRIPHGEIILVVSDRKGAYALARAQRFGIPGETLAPKALGGREAFETALSQLLAEHRVDLVRPLAPAHPECSPLPDPVLLREGDVRSEGP